ncbi:Plant calmodulin-binding protein-related [Striga hermonthica]|uniref:Plant calmodulin-binding protein-related n=1 Tax=Striga hermonthica TaxID=68872 RepID=A0A9N7NTX1_STRHE|nr:Plant calmodulin-binding protein-related [Striga hermonthica]
MAKTNPSRLSTDTPMKLEKTNPRANCLRRKSTGYSSLKSDEPTSSTPNYLRASTGSCHDFCKYGIKRALPIKPWPPVGRKLDKNGNDMLLLSVSDENPRRKMILTSPRKQHLQTNVRVKPEPLKTTDSFGTQPKKNFLKNSSNARIDTRTPKTSKKSSSFQPVSGPPALPLSSNIRTNKSSQKKTPHSEMETMLRKKPVLKMSWRRLFI